MGGGWANPMKEESVFRSQEIKETIFVASILPRLFLTSTQLT